MPAACAIRTFVSIHRSIRLIKQNVMTIRKSTVAKLRVFSPINELFVLHSQLTNRPEKKGLSKNRY